MKTKSTLKEKNANDFLTHTKKQRGITLIALIVTIIILLILAAVSIGALAGNNGLFGKAKDAERKMNMAREKENNTLSDYASEIDKYLEPTGNGINISIQKIQIPNYTKLIANVNYVDLNDMSCEEYIREKFGITQNEDVEKLLIHAEYDNSPEDYEGKTEEDVTINDVLENMGYDSIDEFLDTYTSIEKYLIRRRYVDTEGFYDYEENKVKSYYIENPDGERRSTFITKETGTYTFKIVLRDGREITKSEYVDMDNVNISTEGICHFWVNEDEFTCFIGDTWLDFVNEVGGRDCGFVPFRNFCVTNDSGVVGREVGGKACDAFEIIENGFHYICDDSIELVF